MRNDVKEIPFALKHVLQFVSLSIVRIIVLCWDEATGVQLGSQCYLIRIWSLEGLYILQVGNLAITLPSRHTYLGTWWNAWEAARSTQSILHIARNNCVNIPPLQVTGRCSKLPMADCIQVTRSNSTRPMIFDTARITLYCVTAKPYINPVCTVFTLWYAVRDALDYTVPSSHNRNGLIAHWLTVH